MEFYKITLVLMLLIIFAPLMLPEKHIVEFCLLSKMGREEVIKQYDKCKMEFWTVRKFLMVKGKFPTKSETKMIQKIGIDNWITLYANDITLSDES